MLTRRVTVPACEAVDARLNAPGVMSHPARFEDEVRGILTPDDKPMPYQVAASSWGHIIGCAKYNDKVPDAFRAFRDAYRLKGPEYFPNAE